MPLPVRAAHVADLAQDPGRLALGDRQPVGIIAGLAGERSGEEILRTVDADGARLRALHRIRQLRHVAAEIDHRIRQARRCGEGVAIGNADAHAGGADDALVRLYGAGIGKRLRVDPKRRRRHG